MLVTLAIVGGLGSPASAAGRGATFHGLGDVLGGGFSSSAQAVSGDGRVVAGGGVVANAGVATRWVLNPDGSIASTQNLGVLDGGSVGSIATALSFDGSVVVGTSNSLQGISGIEAFRWTAAGGMVGLGDLPGNNFQSTAKGVSADGSVVVGDGLSLQANNGACAGIPGEGRIEAYRWTSSGGMVALDDPTGVNQPHSFANCVSNDGSVIAGYVKVRPTCTGLFDGPPVRWINGSASVIGSAAGQFTDVSPDGTTLVGYAPAGVSANGFTWTNSGGLVPIGSTALPQGVSTNGQVVVGSSIQSPLKAFIWDSTHGMRFLQDVLINEFGVTNLTGWNLTNARGISDDGLTIVGHGTNPSGQTEGWVATLPCPPTFAAGQCVEVDTDGDGLLDDWEENGIPYTDGNGDEQRYILELPPYDGHSDADPLHKDLFVEVDCMDGIFFSDIAVFLVENAFDDAPVQNPDGQTGINLHVHVDDQDMPFMALWQWDNNQGWAPNSCVYKQNYFGTDAERIHPDAVPIRAAKATAYRYCQGINELTISNPGQAEVPGNDFMLCFNSPFLLDGENDTEEQAAMFMHELGHTLGLSHGGLGDGTNGKPNYVSIMNYLLCYREDWNDGFWKLDYSRTEMPTLDELSLNELEGISSNGVYSHVEMPFGIDVVDVGTVFREVSFARLDGSPVDFGGLVCARDMLIPDGQFTNSVCQDVNYHGPMFPISGANLKQLHTSPNDWLSIQYAVTESNQCVSPLSAAVGGSGGVPDEITFEIIAALDNMPLPPSACPFEVTNNEVIDIDDLVVVITNWGDCRDRAASCPADVFPIIGDRVVNIDDLVAVITNWGTCP